MRISLTLAIILTLPGAAVAQEQPAPQPDYFRKDDTAADEIVFRIDRERTAGDWYLVGGLGAGAAIMGGLGLLFHLRTNDATADVEADQFTARTWGPALQDRYDSSVRSSRIATVSYVLAGGLAVATIVAYLATDPGTEIVRRPKSEPPPYIVPIQGGVIVGKGWAF